MPYRLEYIKIVLIVIKPNEIVIVYLKVVSIFSVVVLHMILFISNSEFMQLIFKKLKSKIIEIAKMIVIVIIKN